METINPTERVIKYSFAFLITWVAKILNHYSLSWDSKFGLGLSYWNCHWQKTLMPWNTASCSSTPAWPCWPHRHSLTTYKPFPFIHHQSTQLPRQNLALALHPGKKPLMGVFEPPPSSTLTMQQKRPVWVKVTSLSTLTQTKASPV